MIMIIGNNHLKLILLHNSKKLSPNRGNFHVGRNSVNSFDGIELTDAEAVEEIGEKPLILQAMLHEILP